MRGSASSVQSGVEFYNTVGGCSVLNFCQENFDYRHLIRQLAAIARSLTNLPAIMFTVIQEDILAIVGACTLRIEFKNIAGLENLVSSMPKVELSQPLKEQECKV